MEALNISYFGAYIVKIGTNVCDIKLIELFRTKPLCNHSLNSFFILLCHWANTLSRLMWMEWVIDIQKLKLIFATLFGTRSQNVFILFGTNERWGPFMKWHIWIPPVNSWSGKKREEFHWHFADFCCLVFFRKHVVQKVSGTLTIQ